MTGLFLIPVIISIFSIIVKLFKFKTKKYYLVRPLLTIAFFILIFTIAQWAYKFALEETISAAKVIHEECNKNAYCPENPAAWEVDGSRIRKNDLGFWFKYTAWYRYAPKSFEINVHQGPSIGDDILVG